MTRLLAALLALALAVAPARAAFRPAGYVWLPDYPTQCKLLEFLSPAGQTFIGRYPAATWHVLELPPEIPADVSGVSLHWLTVNSQVDGKAFGTYLCFRQHGSSAPHSGTSGQMIGPFFRGSDGGWLKVVNHRIEWRWDISAQSVSPAGFQCTIFADAITLARPQ